MRFLFLDIDGVVATNRTYKAWRALGCPKTFEGYVGLLDPALVSAVNQLAVEAGAAIVVSSDWRFVCPYPVEDVLRRAGFTVPVVGRTPVLPLKVWRLRGHEINAYVVQHDLPLESIVVLDDDLGASESPRGSPVRHGSRVVFTPGNTGVETRHIQRARKMFGLPHGPSV